MKNRIKIYILIFIIGLLTSWIITRSFYKNFIIENDFRNRVAMTSIDKKVLKLLKNEEYDRAIALFKEKIKKEITEIEIEWFIRGDSIYNDILYPTFLDTSKTPKVWRNDL